ncbi:MAG: carboxymuconolactone decarboxylase family protein [Tissierellaceae bacterium]|nr:carboxymuconolactone decarboxylase family protein [Tissierellaceae bacterium]
MLAYKECLENVNKGMLQLTEELAKEMNGFMTLHNAALADRALDTKTKELIALGISIIIKCEPCITSHMDSLINLGVTREEILDTMAVAMFMGGGPAVAYSCKALETFEEFSK